MTVPQPPILAAEERAWNYWFVDGLTNIVVGANTLLFSFSIFAPPHWPPKPIPMLLWVAGLISYVVVTLRYKQIVEWLKERVTYPRTGYVQSPTSDPAEAANLTTFSLGANGVPAEVQMLRMQRRTTFTVTVALAAVACFGFVVIHERWIWAASAVLFSIAMIIARRDFGISWILPVGFPILGLYITAFVPYRLGSEYFIAGMGLLMLLDGAATLIRYVVQNPNPKAPAA